MRLLVTSDLNLAGGAIGLGVDELRFPKPVRPGDSLRLEIEIVDVRPSKTKPDRGTARIRYATRNQNGDVVFHPDRDSFSAETESRLGFCRARGLRRPH